MLASTIASVAIANSSEPSINIVTPADADIVLGWYLAAILSWPAITIIPPKILVMNDTK